MLYAVVFRFGDRVRRGEGGRSEDYFRPSLGVAE